MRAKGRGRPGSDTHRCWGRLPPRYSGCPEPPGRRSPAGPEPRETASRATTRPCAAGGRRSPLSGRPGIGTRSPALCCWPDLPTCSTCVSTAILSPRLSADTDKPLEIVGHLPSDRSRPPSRMPPREYLPVLCPRYFNLLKWKKFH